MRTSLRGFGLTLIAVWTILTLAALAYSHQKDIPWTVTRALLPAILLEAAFYLAAGFESTRKWLKSRLSPVALAALITLSALLPYAAYNLLLHRFHLAPLLSLAVLAGSASFWYVIVGMNAAADWGFLVLMAVPVLAKLFNWLYPEPFPKVAVAVLLGFTMWIHVGLMAVLAIRKMEGIGFGFVPNRREWRIGMLHFVLFLPVGLLLEHKLQVLGLHAARLSWTSLAVALGTFLAFLWVAGLCEEVFVRGMLQQMLTRATRSRLAGLVIASTLFGLAHLGFRAYPNWRFALLAGVTGLFYGSAYSQARSVRASMVTHALVVATWRAFS